jgi:mRNA interferase RelE/StbE
MKWSTILAWRIELSGKAAKQLAKLDKVTATRITTFLRQRLATLADPRSTGEALTGPTLGVYWRYRVGDYRIICDIQDGRLCVLVIEIGNRREVYR